MKMKLLGWMLHKLRPTNIEPFKDFTIGNYCACLSENSFTEFEAKGVEDDIGDETSAVISRLFHGFLTIGTLGSEPIMSEPITPTFATPLENISEEKTEVTENHLKLINDELEKFLEAQAEEHGSNESSRRNSQVSTITLSGKPVQGTNSQDHGKTITCPLQGYLFGSSIDLAETRFEVKKEKASLAELFHRTKIEEESPTEKCANEEMKNKQNNKPVKHLIKKVLKKIHASSVSSISSAKESNSAATNKKLQKVIKLFHRKVHPESSIADRESKMLHGKKTNNAPYSDNKWFPRGLSSTARPQDYKTISELPKYELAGLHAATANGEHWIKTDADYLVLEL
ncbi:protein LAZY 1-like isoform X2 [Hibiscus syriacus]|uniref:protein LAZY 1-like isoform X2 n=1 Tax=Hibiscus syriacus TaxID=106335 RepID=UPI001924EFE3|nr:protein LAZY 1-like isoform X2 [Hibiscus syriacus]